MNAGLAVLAAVTAGLVAAALSGASGTGSATPLTSTYTPQVTASQAPKPAFGKGRTVFMGDSITAGDTTTVTGRSGPRSWVRYATEAKGSPWKFAANVAVGGQETSVMADRFARDVLARDPDVVVILAGTNDLGHRTPTSQTLGNIGRMVDATRAKGATPVLLTVPPNNQDPTMPLPFNARLKEFAAVKGVAVVDIYPAVADGSQWKPGLTMDGKHPNNAGAKVIGQAVAKAIS